MFNNLQNIAVHTPEKWVSTLPCNTFFSIFLRLITEKCHFTPENRARTAKLRVPIDSVGKKYIEICTLVT